MIVRDKVFYKGSNSCTFSLCLTDVDVRRCLIEFYVRSYVQGFYDFFSYQTQESLIGMLLNVSKDLKETKYGMMVANWAFDVAVRKGYVEQVDATLYKISDELQNLCELKATKERGY